jgi:hypothetical protein
VRRQEPIDNDLPLVSGWLGQAAFVEGSCRRIRHDVAEKFLDECCTRTMRSRLEPMKKVARTYEAVETTLYHNLGALPEPEFAHRFW